MSATCSSTEKPVGSPGAGTCSFATWRTLRPSARPDAQQSIQPTTYSQSSFAPSIPASVAARSCRREALDVEVARAQLLEVERDLDDRVRRARVPDDVRQRGELRRRPPRRGRPACSTETLSRWSPIVPRFQPFLPWTFTATAPPSVTCIVPVTTGGQKPFGIEAFQSSPSVSPAPARTIPVSASRLRIAFSRVSSTTGPAGFSAASPYERPAPRKTGVSPRARQSARTAASSSTEDGR